MPNALTIWAIRGRHLLSHVFEYWLWRYRDIFKVELTFEMLTVRGQRHSFSTRERMFLWKYWRFKDRKCLDPRGARITNRSPVNSTHKGQWRGALVFCCFIYAWTNAWVNNWGAGGLKRHCAHYDFIVMVTYMIVLLGSCRNLLCNINKISVRNVCQMSRNLVRE